MNRFLPTFVLCVVAGCGSPKFHPVEGTVTFADGTPMKGGSVEFRSEEEETKGLTATGAIDETGKFTLQTYSGDKYKPGAVAGKHSVIVTPPPDEGSKAGVAPPPVLHADLLSYEKSGLKFVVNPGPNSCTLTVRIP